MGGCFDDGRRRGGEVEAEVFIKLSEGCSGSFTVQCLRFQHSTAVRCSSTHTAQTKHVKRDMLPQTAAFLGQQFWKSCSAIGSYVKLRGCSLVTERTESGISCLGPCHWLLLQMFSNCNTFCDKSPKSKYQTWHFVPYLVQPTFIISSFVGPIAYAATDPQRGACITITRL